MSQPVPDIDPNEPRFWRPRNLKEEFATWLSAPRAMVGRRPRTPYTASTVARNAYPCVRAYAEGGPDRLKEVLDEAVLHTTRRSQDGAAWQRIAAWREFVAWLHCVKKLPLPPRHPALDTPPGTLLARTIGDAVRILAERMPVHALAVMTVRDFEPELFGPRGLDALRHLLRWGYSYGASRLNANTHRDYYKAPLLPRRPGSHDHMLAVVVADIASRAPQPGDIVTPVHQPGTPEMFKHIYPGHPELPPDILAFNRTHYLDVPRIPPSSDELRAAESDMRKKRALARAAFVKPPPPRAKSPYDMTTEEFLAGIDEGERNTRRAAAEENAKRLFTPAAPAAAREPWHITANVAGVKALGEVPAASAQDSHHWSLKVNVAGVVGLGEDGQKPLLTEREAFDEPGYVP